MKIRSITYFCDGSFPLDGKAMAQAGACLQRARAALLQAGYEVQTTRAALQPLVCKHERFDLLHAMAFVVPLLATLPTVATIYDLTFRKLPQRFRAANRAYLSLFARLSCRRAARVIAISHSTKRDVMQAYGIDGNRIDVIYPGLRVGRRRAAPRAVAEFREQRGLPARFILYLGTIEPLAVVELANQWRALQSAVAAEERRILLELSALVGAQATAVRMLVQLLAELDLALAKARHADALHASPAQLQAWAAAGPPAGSGLQLRGARHPLLPAQSAVAIDAVPHADTRIIVISGPNTGGKTVALKTIALLALMNQCGLHIPALPGALLPVFSGVYADIGDEQSLQQNLSTFSAHLTNIIRILAQVDARALVVLDELGAGTDPSEGSALARAILSHLLESGATTIVSSHSHKLKDYAHNTPGVTNASVEFDPQTLAPTYRLTIGLPGRSNALAIAARLGLPQSIVAAARTLVTAQDQQANNLLEDIQLQLQVARDERALAESEHARARQHTATLALLQQQLATGRAAAKATALASAQQELDSLRLAAAQLRADLNAARLPLLALRAAEQEIIALEETFAQPEPQPDGLPVTSPGTVRLGDTVLVSRLNATGVVTALTASEAEVRVGRLLVRAQLDELRPAPAAAEPATETTEPAPAQRASPGLELHLRGERVEDGLEKLERHLDAAALAGLPWVRIVHGKGTGRMRSAVRSALRDNPQVTAVQSVPENEGGEGVTLAMLA